MDPKPSVGHLPEFLTAEEAAALLRVNRKTFYRALERGEVPGVVRIGRLTRIRRSALLPDDE